MVSLPTHITAGEPIAIDATVTNRGASIWLASHEPYGGVALGAHLYDGDGKLITFDVHWQQLTQPPREIGPGETVTVRFALPPLDAGRYVLEFDCVAARVSWFAPLGSKPARVALEVAVRDV
jgi:hypothetical protein